DTDKTPEQAIASANPANLSGPNTVNGETANGGSSDVGAKAYWGDEGAGYRFNLSNIGNNYKNKSARDMFESELRIGTTTNHYSTTDTPWGPEIANSAIPARDDIETYEQAVRGFQTKAVMLNNYLLTMADVNYITFTYYPKTDENGDPFPAGTVPAKKTVKLTYAELLAAYPRNANGDLVIPSDAWEGGFLTNAVVRFDRVRHNMELAKAYADVWGYADDVRDMPLSAWFGCTYPYNDWHYNYVSYDRNNERTPARFGNNVAGYSWQEWINHWTPGSSRPNVDSWGLTRVGAFVQYLQGNTGCPQYEWQVAEYKTYWTGDDVFSDGAATAFIYGRPYEVNEGVAGETFMRSTGVTEEKGYDDTASGVDQSSKLTKTGTTNAYYNESGSGYRFTLTNDKAPTTEVGAKKPANTMYKAYFSTTKIPFVEDADATDDKKRYVSFHTENIALSKELFDVVGYKDKTTVADRAGVKDLTLYWREYGDTADKSLTLKGTDLEAIATGVLEETDESGAKRSTLSDDEWISAENARVYKDENNRVHVVRLVNVLDENGDPVMEGEGDEAKPKKQDGPEIMYVQKDGDLIITEALWDGWYFRNMEMHLRNFKGQVTKDSRAFVEFWGTGDWRHVGSAMDVYAMFRTDWITGWWNTNNQGTGSTNIINSGFSATTKSNETLNNYTRWNYQWISTGVNSGYNGQYNTGNGTYNVFSKYHKGNASYTARTSARLNITLLPVRPKVEMWAYKDASTYNLKHNQLTAKYETSAQPGVVSGEYGRWTSNSSHRSQASWGTQPRAYYHDESVGYRAVVTNDSRYDIDAGVTLTLGNLTPNSSNLAPALLGNVGFRTTKLTLSKALYNAGQKTVYVDASGNEVAKGTPGAKSVVRNSIKKITLNWYVRDGKATRNTLTVNGNFVSGSNSAKGNDTTTTYDYNGGHYTKAGLPVYANGYTSATTAGTPLHTTVYSGDRVASWFAGKGDTNDWLTTAGETFYAYDVATNAYTAVTAASGEDLMAAQADGTLYVADGTGDDATRGYLQVEVRERAEDETDEDSAKIYEYRFAGEAVPAGITVDSTTGDVIIDPSMWLGGDLASVTIEYDWYKGLGKGYAASATASKDAYVDFFGYAIDSPDVDATNKMQDTWCINDGFDANDGSWVTSDFDWFYDIVDLPADIHTTYNKREVKWSNGVPTYSGTDWDNLAGHTGYYSGNTYLGNASDNKKDGWRNYKANSYGELNRTCDFAEMFTHMPASSQKVTAKTFFADKPAPLVSDTAALADTTRTYLNYYGAGWRFTYTNYANPTRVKRSNADSNHWQVADNVYDRDYEMFDSYMEIGAMPAAAVPDGNVNGAYLPTKDETLDYANSWRDFDAKYLTITAGLLQAATWAKRGTDRGNALKTVKVTVLPNTGETVPAVTPEGDGDESGDADADADPDIEKVTSTTSGTTVTTTVLYKDGHKKHYVAVDGKLSTIQFEYTLDQLVANGAFWDNKNAATGNLVLPNTLWDGCYFSKVRVDVAHFNAGVKEADKAVIEVLGANDVSQTNVTLQSVFNTCYKENGYLNGAVNSGNWDHQTDTYGTYSGYLADSYTAVQHTLDKYGRQALTRKTLGDGLYGYSYQDTSNGMDRYDAATLVPQVDPATPTIEARSLVSEEGPADSGSYVEYDKRAGLASNHKDFRCVETLLGTENSGWRFYVRNNSNYSLDSTRFTAGTFYSELVDGEWRGFDLKNITLNEPMLMALLVEKLDEMEVVAPTVPSDPVAALAKQVSAMEIKGDNKYNHHAYQAAAIKAKLDALSEEQMKKLLEGYTIDLYTIKRDDATVVDNAATANANGSKPAKMPSAPTYTVNLSDYVKKADVIVSRDATGATGDKTVSQWVVQIPAGQGWDGETRPELNADGTEKKDANGDTVYWPGTYVLKTVMHLPEFASAVNYNKVAGDTSTNHLGLYGGQEPFIDFHGVPSRAVHMKLYGNLSTEYKTESWNTEDSDSNHAYTSTSEALGSESVWACMIPLTAEPAMRTTFSWSGGDTNENHMTVSVAENGYTVITPSEIANPRNHSSRTGYVPYRWSDDPEDAGKDATAQQRNETAFYKYMLENPTRSLAENGYLDMVLNNVKKITNNGNTDWRGFIGTQLQIDGYYRQKPGDTKHVMLRPADFEDGKNSSTEWYNRGGKIGKIEIFRADQTVFHDNAEHKNGNTVVETDTPMATITLDQATLENLLAATPKGEYGTLVLELDEKSLAPYMNIDPKTNQKFAWGPVGTVRLAYDSMAARMMTQSVHNNPSSWSYSGVAADKVDNRAQVGVYDTDRNDAKDGTAFVARIYGKVMTHGDKNSATDANSYNNVMSSSTYYFPKTSYYGNINRSQTCSVYITPYNATSSSSVFKKTSTRPVTSANPTGSDVTTQTRAENASTSTIHDYTRLDSNSSSWINSTNSSQRVTVEAAKRSDGNGYEFTYRNTTRARSDAATLTMRIDSVSMKAKEMLTTDAYSEGDLDTAPFYKNYGVVRGFKTAQLNFGTALMRMGSFTGAKLTFLQPNGQKFVLSLTPMDFAAYKNADNTYTINLHDAFVAGGKTVRSLTTAGQIKMDTTGNAAITTDSTLNYTIDDCYLYQVDLNYSNLEPTWRANMGAADATDADSRLTMKATGKADWYNSVGNVDGSCSNTYTSNNSTYYPHNDLLHTRIWLTQAGPHDTRANVQKCAALSVPRPAMEVHTFIRYGNTADYTETSRSDSACNDGNRTEVTVPYAKTFRFWAQLRNEPRSGTQAYSKLDDTDVTFVFPVDWDSFYAEKASATPSAGVDTNGKTSAYTGFHPIQTTIKGSYIDCFPDKSVGKIRIWGYSPTQVATHVKQDKVSKAVLKPYYNGDALAGWELEYTTGFASSKAGFRAAKSGTIEKAGGAYPTTAVRFPVDPTTGDFTLTEDEVCNKLGIEIPTQLQLFSWKDMAEDAVNYANQNVFITGYTDSNFETQRTISVTTANHMDCFRELPLDLPLYSGTLHTNTEYGSSNTAADNYTVTRFDRSLIFVSKMYYDAVSRAAYADVNSGEDVVDKSDTVGNDKSLIETIADAHMPWEAEGYESEDVDADYKNPDIAEDSPLRNTARWKLESAGYEVYNCEFTDDGKPNLDTLVAGELVYEMSDPVYAEDGVTVVS
ncbi:MAG: hypothetical protein UCH28_06245, partial [Adlercreutzia sp.]|nr:hypothetical protein [Adlercreutzia sp.]